MLWRTAAWLAREAVSAVAIGKWLVYADEHEDTRTDRSMRITRDGSDPVVR